LGGLHGETQRRHRETQRFLCPAASLRYWIKFSRSEISLYVLLFFFIVYG